MTISVKDSEVSELYDNDNLKKLGITIYFWYNVSCQIYS